MNEDTTPPWDAPTEPPQQAPDIEAQLRAAVQSRPVQPKRRNPWPFIAAGVLIVLGTVGVIVGLTSGGGGEVDAVRPPVTAQAPATTAAPTTTIAPTTTEAPTTTAPECEGIETRGEYESRERCHAGHWLPSPQTRPTTPPVTEPPGPDLASAQQFLDIFVGRLTPDLVAICPLLRTSPLTLRSVMREGFDDPKTHELATTFGYSYSQFEDMFVVTYSNRLVQDCS